MNPQDTSTSYLRGSSSSLTSEISSTSSSSSSSLMSRLLSNFIHYDDKIEDVESFVWGTSSSSSSSSSENITTLAPSWSPSVAPSSSSNTSTEFVEDDYSSSSNSDIHTNPLALTLPRISACLSLLAVICVALEAWHDYRADQRQRALSSTSGIIPQSRSRKVPTVTYIQLFFQIPLGIQAIALALGTNPVPASAYYADVWGASGTTATCDIQGLMVQFSMIGCVGWDMALSTAYLLMVRYNVRSTRLQSSHKYYHFIIWPIALLMSIYPLTQGMYNYNTTVCWLESFPNECQGDECERGANSLLWQNITSFIAMIHFVFSVIVVLVLYCTVRRLTNQSTSSHQQDSNHKSVTSKGEQQGRRSSSSSSTNYSRAIGIQGMLYASGIFITVLPTVILIMLWNALGIWSDGFSIFATTMTPLMGYVNFVIFMRGRRIKDCHTKYAKFLRRIHSWMFDQSWIRTLCGCWSYLCCCTCHCNIEWTGPPHHQRQHHRDHNDDGDDGTDPRRRRRRRRDDEEDPSSMEDMTASMTHRLNQSLGDFTSREFSNFTGHTTGTGTSRASSLYHMDQQDERKDDVLAPPPVLDNDEQPPHRQEEDLPSPAKKKRSTSNKKTTPTSWLGSLISWTSRSSSNGGVKDDDGQPQFGGATGSTAVGSQMIISELGCESVGTPNPDDSKHFDFSPSKPTRRNSGPKKKQDRLPPIQPRRAITEELEEEDSDNSSSDSSDQSFNFPPDTKPNKIPRLRWGGGAGNYVESFLETFSGPTKKNLNKSSEQIPVRPMRLESLVSEMTLEEIEDWHYASRSSRSLLAPPSLPQRLVSEVEEMTSCDEESRCSAASSHGATVNVVRPNNTAVQEEVDPDTQSLSSAMKAAMRVVERTMILEEDDTTAPINTTTRCRRGSDEGMAPAVQPQRFLSEVESVGSSDGSGVDVEFLRVALQDYLSGGAYNNANDHIGTTRPTRSSSSAEVKPAAATTRGGWGGSDQVPPTPPIRLVSEVEGLSDTECESDSSEALKIPVQQEKEEVVVRSNTTTSSSAIVVVEDNKDALAAAQQQPSSRFASEVEVAEWMIDGISSVSGSSPQSSFKSSSDESLLKATTTRSPLTNARGSDQVPPVPPIRFTTSNSEVEGPLSSSSDAALKETKRETLKEQYIGLWVMNSQRKPGET